jgi:hypothetical protein
VDSTKGVTCIVGVIGGSIAGVTAGGGEVIVVHPPTRTNPILHTMRIRMGNSIQGKCYFDMINVPKKACCKNTGELHLSL